MRATREARITVPPSREVAAEVLPGDLVQAADVQEVDPRPGVARAPAEIEEEQRRADDWDD